MVNKSRKKVNHPAGKTVGKFKRGLDSIVDVGNQGIVKVDKKGYDTLMGVGGVMGNPAEKFLGAKRKASSKIVGVNPSLAPAAKGGSMLDDLGVGIGTKLATSDLFQKAPAPSFYKRAVRDNALRTFKAEPKRPVKDRSEQPVMVKTRQTVPRARKSRTRAKKK